MEGFDFKLIILTIFSYIIIVTLAAQIFLLVLVWFIFSEDDLEAGYSRFVGGVNQRVGDDQTPSYLDQMNIKMSPDQSLCMDDGKDDNLSCAICLTDFKSSKDNEYVRMPCHHNHVFHADCLN